MKNNVEMVFDKALQVSEQKLYGNDKRCNHRLHKIMTIVADSLFEAFLETLLKAGASATMEKLNSYAVNQLPGGLYWEAQAEVGQVLSLLKPSNDICESVLGLNNYLTTALPNLDQVSRSNLIQIKKNKTLDWLDQLPSEKQDSIVNLAVKISDACKKRGH